MGDLERYNGKPPATRQEQLDKAASDAISNMYTHVNKVFREKTGEVVRNTKAIADDQHYHYAAGFAEESTKIYAGQLLQLYNDASDDVRSIAKKYRGTI